ncbi:glycosyltransferase family 4 protein [Oligoflexia bacterium]|nr:glycosyltransferase family 4 protein [Oligoflexia bacterium]
MKITFVVNALTAGGAERIVTTLANYWSEKGWQVTILTFDNGSTPPFYTLNEQVIHIPLNVGTAAFPLLKKLLSIPGIIRQLRLAIKKAEADTVIAFMDQANILTALAARKLPVNVLVSERVHPAMSSIVLPEKFFLTRFVMESVRNFAYGFADHVVLLSEHSKTYYPKALHKKIAVIPNPVLTHSEPAPDLELRGPCVLAMGRLTAQKNFPLLISAFKNVADRQPDWRLVIVGEGEQRSALEEQIAALNLTGRILLPGLTKTPLGVLKQAEIFVLSSDWEGFPNVLCEAMLCGKACVATDCLTGPSEIIEHEQNGLLVPAGDRSALETTLESLMVDADLRGHLGANASEALERFNIEHVASRWEELCGAGG